MSGADFNPNQADAATQFLPAIGDVDDTFIEAFRGRPGHLRMSWLLARMERLQSLTVAPGAVLPAAPASSVSRVVGADGATAALSIEGAGGAPRLLLARSEGTAAAPSAVTIGTPVGTLAIRGYKATDWSSEYTCINFPATTAWTDGSTPFDIVFSTIPVGSTTPVERFRITAAGACKVQGMLQIAMQSVAMTDTGVTTATLPYLCNKTVGTIASHTLILPTGPGVGQVFCFSTRGAITALTVTGTCNVKPTAMVANSSFSWIYNADDNIWMATSTA